MDRATFEELTEMALLYRKHVEFAVGHGVAVHAELSPQDPTRCIRLETRAVPFFEVEPQTSPDPGEPGFEGLVTLQLDMKELAAAMSPADLVGKLTALKTSYRTWIEKLEAKLDDPKEFLRDHTGAAKSIIAKCFRTLTRIEAGIVLLREDRNAFRAFKFANRAMFLQRVHSIYAENRRREKDVSLSEIAANPKNHSWYPFQLAFILLNLPSCTDLHHPDRSDEAQAIADLLWFPTGGGKTEAYLGLAAYVMGLRRLQGDIEGRSGECGLAVLMRYTLRLLTLQQFQRASALICACEITRRQDPQTWGAEPFRIGLWVGGRATPNWTSQSKAALDQAFDQNDDRAVKGASPAQLKNCPWCGSEIRLRRDIRVEGYPSGHARTFIYCGDESDKCDFSRGNSEEGLPVLVVDEEIYRLLPAMVVATVDKFAQLPWNGRTEMLFGQVDGRCPRHGFKSPEMEDDHSHNAAGRLPAVRSEAHGPLRPPDLIIQDELHLISGPLGSLVGLYETAIDELCSWEVGGKRVRPKVIASTATVRNALAQVHAVFLRHVEIFPPPGLSIEDDFFSVRRASTAEILLDDSTLAYAHLERD